MADLADVNELAKHHCDFQIASFDGCRLVVVGSFDLCYYHDIELRFLDVEYIDCPVRFHNPVFVDEGRIPGSPADDPRRYIIRTDEGVHRIDARTIEIVLGTVYYYDRGTQLLPGERIADFVKRGDASN